MATRTETAVRTIAPQTRQAVGLNTYIETQPKPGAGQEFMQIADALGIVAGKVAKTEAQKKAENEALYSENLDYYANSFMADRTNGIVDATQVGRAFPGASPIVAGKITSLIGANWAEEYTRTRFDEFLKTPEAANNPEAQRQFFDSIRTEIAGKTQGNPFYGSGAIAKANSVINEYQGNLQRSAATYHQGLIEQDFTANVVAGLSGQPIVGNNPHGGYAPSDTTEFLKTRLVVPDRVSDVADMRPDFAQGIAGMIQNAPPGIAEGLGILSGTRSVERQTALWNDALKKYGSAAAARKWVAPPGKSKHNSGEAADLSWNGKSLKHAPKEVIAWVHENAAQFGLHFPLANENWHVEPVGSRGAPGPTREAAASGLKINVGDRPGAVGPVEFGKGIDTSNSPTALLEMIGGAEADGQYNAIYGNAGQTKVQVTGMTLSEVLTYQRQLIASGAAGSAIGKYQMLPNTLRGAMKSLGLTGDEVFSPAMQDELALHLLKQRGYDDFVAGKITASEFQDNLAKEWASLPTTAGGGYYDGQNPRVSGDQLRVAMSTTGDVTNPVLTLDQYAGSTSSINPVRRRQIIVDQAVALATARRDPTILDRIPQEFLSIPEIELSVVQTRDKISQLTFDDWNHQVKVEEFNKKAALEETQKTILSELQGGTLDITKYMNDPDAYAFARQVRADELVPPAVSASNKARLESTLMSFGTGGFPSDYPGATPLEKMRLTIVGADGLTAADRSEMLGKIDTYLAGMDLITDSQANTHYTNTVGIGLQTYLATLDGSMAKKFGANPTGTVRNVYDSTYQTLVLEAIQEGRWPLVGADKRAMLKESSDAALAVFQTMREAPDAAATPTKPAAPAAEAAPIVSDDARAVLKARREAGEKLTPTELSLLFAP